MRERSEQFVSSDDFWLVSKLFNLIHHKTGLWTVNNTVYIYKNYTLQNYLFIEFSQI